MFNQNSNGTFYVEPSNSGAASLADVFWDDNIPQISIGAAVSTNFIPQVITSEPQDFQEMASFNISGVVMGRTQQVTPAGKVRNSINEYEDWTSYYSPRPKSFRKILNIQPRAIGVEEAQTQGIEKLDLIYFDEMISPGVFVFIKNNATVYGGKFYKITVNFGKKLLIFGALTTTILLGQAFVHSIQTSGIKLPKFDVGGIHFIIAPTFIFGDNNKVESKQINK